MTPSKRETHKTHTKHAGIDAAMFVKMSATDTRAATVLQPGAKWVFGAYELLGGAGVRRVEQLEPLREVLGLLQGFWRDLLVQGDAAAA